jgi:hypothetical protein
MTKTNKDKQCYARPWYCLTFFDVFCITLFVLVGFDHGIVWRSSMCFVLQCLSLSVLAMVLSDVLRCVLLCKIHRRMSDNTSAKTNKDKQCYTKHIEERQTIPLPRPTKTNNVIQNTSKNVRQYHGDVFCITWFVLVGFRHGIVWRSSMCFVMQNTSKNVRQYQCQNQQGQTMLCKTHRRTSDNTIADVLHNIVCPCWFWPWYFLTFFDVFCVTLLVLVQNTSKNVRQYHGQNQQGQRMLYKAHGNVLRCFLCYIVSPCWFWPWYCLTFFDVLCITLFVLVGFGHGIVWSSAMCFI